MYSIQVCYAGIDRVDPKVFSISMRRPNVLTINFRVAVTRSKDVALFGPPIPKGATFPKSKSFAEFLLAKGS